MSFEGYAQILCKNGHYSNCDIYDPIQPTDKEWECTICGEKCAWTHIVDTTNGSHDEDGKRIDGYVELKQEEPPVYCTCEDCGDRHVIKAAIYKIPKKTGHKTK